ncbi:hypothetical protein LCGC14_2530440, partial [marine sediment metagenome]
HIRVALKNIFPLPVDMFLVLLSYQGGDFFVQTSKANSWLNLRDWHEEYEQRPFVEARNAIAERKGIAHTTMTEGS